MIRSADCLASCGIILAALAGCGGPPVAAPTSYQTWNASDGTFAIKYPDGWKAEGGGKHGVQWAEFSKGSAKIKVDVSTVSSLLSDIARSAGTVIGVNDPSKEVDPELAEALAPVVAAHSHGLEWAEEEFVRYKEQDAVPFQSQLGDSRKSEFTASGGFGGRIRGYRATTLSTDKGIHIICSCPESNWKTLQPAFDEILQSIRAGSP